MSRFNNAVKVPVKRGVVTSQSATGITGNGAPGFAREAVYELFLLAVSNFVGADAHYESGSNRDDRMAQLAATVAVNDVDTLTKMVRWLRNDANMRTAPMIIAAEGAHARLANGLAGGNRELLRASLSRADELGELAGYWTTKFGKKFPKAFKRALADGVADLVTQYSVIKYDTAGKDWRFGDIMHIAQPATLGNPSEEKNALYKYTIDNRHGRVSDIPLSLGIIRRNKEILALSPKAKRSLLDAGQLNLEGTGITWEQLASSIDGGADAKFWEAMIPQMGYMALLRNLRNFQEKGVSKQVLGQVLARLSDPEQVAHSRQLPMRFLSAYNANQGNLAIAAALEMALDASLANVPALSGNTLILVDRSGSMFGNVSKNTGLNFADSAALFGTALALRGEKVNLVQFGSAYYGGQPSYDVTFKKGDSILPIQKQFKNLGGTDTVPALKRHFNGHDRIILLTDEQSNSYYSGYGSSARRGVFEAAGIPVSTIVHTFNLAGYGYGHAPSGTKNRYHIGGGLSDVSFGIIPLLEASASKVLPWEVREAK